ncbi:vesicle-associated membrane protein 4 isoform X1 [Cephus cinctus]|uniref:Vesicle-associated membrane protein 4 isoform X1 n=1 Tax=Cephus cinctus TaxID=211228 RepID=A0AAJ7W5C4_CEPCN|nr:vesicle-associated membrane protein 4 isoform X1 [Cephus cinctus]
MPPKFRRTLSGEDLRAADEVEKESLLEHDSDPDEDMLFNRPSTSTENVQVHGKLDSVRIQIKEVTDTMRDNMQKVIERGDRMEDLQSASERLSMAGNEFRDAARNAQRKAWMQNVKARIIIGGITLMLVLCIVVNFIRSYKYSLLTSIKISFQDEQVEVSIVISTALEKRELP